MSNDFFEGLAQSVESPSAKPGSDFFEGASVAVDDPNNASGSDFFEGQAAKQPAKQDDGMAGIVQNLATGIYKSIQNALAKKKQEAYEADPQNFSSTRLKASLPPAQTVDEKAKQEAALAITKEREKGLKQKAIDLAMGGPAALAAGATKPDEGVTPSLISHKVMASPTAKAFLQAAMGGPTAPGFAEAFRVGGAAALAPMADLAKSKAFRVAGIPAIPFSDVDNVVDDIDKSMANAFLGYTHPGVDIMKAAEGPLGELPALITAQAGAGGLLSDILNTAQGKDPGKIKDSAGTELLGTQLEFMANPSITAAFTYPLQIRYKLANDIFQELGKGLFNKRGIKPVVDEVQFAKFAEAKSPAELRNILKKVKEKNAEETAKTPEKIDEVKPEPVAPEESTEFNPAELERQPELDVSKMGREVPQEAPVTTERPATPEDFATDVQNELLSAEPPKLVKIEQGAGENPIWRQIGETPKWATGIVKKEFEFTIKKVKLGVPLTKRQQGIYDQYQAELQARADSLNKQIQEDAAGTPYDTPEIKKLRAEQNALPPTIEINTPERIEIRKRWAEEHYGEGAKKKEKRIDLVIGLPASGKSSLVAKPLAQENGSVIIDADMVKEMIPEYEGGKMAGRVHDESAVVAEDALYRALKSGDNIVAPIIGKNTARIVKKVRRLAKAGYRVYVHNMSITPEESAKRVVTRLEETNRFVDPIYPLSIGLKPESTYDILKKEESIRGYRKLSNQVPKGQPPELIEKELSEEGPGGSGPGFVREGNGPGGIPEGRRTKSQEVIDAAVQESSPKETIEMHAGIPLPGMRQARVVNDTVEGGQGIKFANPETEKRFVESQGQTKESILSRVKTFTADTWNRATRTYPELPNDPKFAELRTLLNKQAQTLKVAQDRAFRALDAITAEMGPKRFEIFTRKVVLDDLVREAQAGRAVPFGYSHYDDVGNLVIDHEAIKADKAAVDALVEKNPAIKKAVEKRKQLWEAVTEDLVENGILKKDQVKEDYFRHQVLEYANAKATFGTGRKLRAPNPGYAKGRHGSTYDINTSYLEAEGQVLSQSLHDIQTAKNIDKLETSKYNISERLKDEAAEYNKTAEAGKEKTFRDFVPDGYRTWQPKEGRVFYTAYSVPQRIINQALQDVYSTKGAMDVNLLDLEEITALGAPRKELVLPEEVAETLDNLYTVKPENFIRQGSKYLTTQWKKWVLFNPRRAFKYNWQNFIGDTDAVIAGEPGVFKKFPKAYAELWDVFYKGKPMPKDMQEFFERGGLDSEMTIQEIPEIRNLPLFRRLWGEADKAEAIKDKLNIFGKYWESVVRATSFRESIARYASYLYYKEKFLAGETKYGASIPKEVDAIRDPLDRAAKVSTELIGDYANISALGKDMREAVSPFFSWMEVNLKRYKRLAVNAFQEGAGDGQKARLLGLGTLKGAATLGKWWLRAAMLTGSVMLYNQLFHKDEEADLSPYDQNRVHITIGRDKKTGEVIILRGQSAFGDVLEWFGLDQFPTLFRDYFDGKASLADIFGKVPLLTGKVGLRPAAMKLIRSINPLYKLPFETLTGKTLPVFDERPGKVEDKVRNILRAVSLENEYDVVKRNPTRGYFRSLGESFITRTDPEENAYRYIQSQKYQFMEDKLGRGGSGDFYSPRSIMYREYKKALRFKDEGAKKRILKDMEKIGVTPSDRIKSIKTTDPLFGLKSEDKAAFVDGYLSKRDREILKRAYAYYEKTFLQGE